MPLDMAEEHRMLQDLVAKFVDDELMPLESKVIEREIAGLAAAFIFSRRPLPADFQPQAERISP